MSTYKNNETEKGEKHSESCANVFFHCYMCGLMGEKGCSSGDG